MNNNSSQKSGGSIPPFATKDENALKINAFSFSKGSSAKTVPIDLFLQSMRKNRFYRDVAVKGNVRLYIEYYYLIPENLRIYYKNRVWERFRYFGGIYGGINRRAKKDPQFPAFLKSDIEFVLENGYDPFAYATEIEREHALETKLQQSPPSASQAAGKTISLDKGLIEYLAFCREMNLRDRTVGSYATLVNFMRDYFSGPEGPEIFDASARLFQPVSSFTRKELLTFLKETASEQEWGASRYNTIASYLTRLFSWFASEDVNYISSSPISKIPNKKTDEKMNTAYTDLQAAAIKKALLEGGPNGQYVHFFCEFIYYTCLRPVEEARVLQRKLLNFQNRTIIIPGSISKNRKLYHIPMADDLHDLLISRQIDKVPGDYYIFGVDHAPATQPVSKNYFASNFRKIRDQPSVLACGITQDHTIYSFKHTRACHLVIDGVPLSEIQQLLKHATLAELESYLRDLGELVSQITAEKARKF